MTDALDGTFGIAGEVVRIYADGGTSVQAETIGDGKCEISISGHLEG